VADLYQEVTELIDLEGTCRAHFDAPLDIKRIVASNIPTGKSSHTTVFETKDRNVYALCESDLPLTLADIKKIMRGMGIEAKEYLPPAFDKDYFLNYGRDAFLAAYPGRKLVTNDDLSYYESLAPYTPALIKIARVKHELRQFVPVVNQWYKTLDYSYNQIEVKK
jgi:hypothetical protein